MIKSLYVTLICLLFFTSSKAQNWAGGVDDEAFHFGFMFQYISSDYKIFKTTNWRNPYRDPENGNFITDSLYSLSSPSAKGFGIGFVSNIRLSENADIRFTPGLSFSDRYIDYNYLDPNKFKQQAVQTTLVDLPIGIKVKSDRRNNFRAYLLAGGKYSMDIISKKKTDDSGFALLEKFVKNNKGYLSYEVGVGFDFYFEFFKLSPELKLSNSVGNVLKAENHPYSSPLDKLYLHSIQFSLFFE
ncbi:MAG: hypothetical protein K0S09_933 [Sphingobacteriaceae bacterium]|jgi:hypothetical protein|nr:hypothetical protein [Sphingobacteriaceae bacterium]